jgi:hypothetical protein
MTGLRLIAFAVLTCVATGGPVMASEAFRCGARLIEPGLSQSEVLELCGEPSARAAEVQDVHSGNRVVGQTTVHRWTYQSYSATRVLVFDADTLKSIE